MSGLAFKVAWAKNTDTVSIRQTASMLLSSGTVDTATMILSLTSMPTHLELKLVSNFVKSATAKPKVRQVNSQFLKSGRVSVCRKLDFCLSFPFCSAWRL